MQFCVVAKFMVYRRGGFHIRPGSLAQAPNRKEGSRPLPTDQHKNHSTTQIVTPQNPSVRRGRRPLRPTCKLASTRCGRMQASAPTETKGCIWPRRGQTVGRRKSVKKNAALLHFLAFPSNDHPFGVPRGRAPWAGVRCLGTAGLFSLPFLVTKKEGLPAV